MQSSGDKEFEHSAMLFAMTLLRYHRFDVSSVCTSLREWSKKPKNGGGGAHFPVVLDSVRELLASGTFSNSALNFIKRLPMNTYVDSTVCFQCEVLFALGWEILDIFRFGF